MENEGRILPPERVTQIEEQLEAAWEMIRALCTPTYAPNHREWRMSIPVRPNYDPDVVIGTALRGLREVLAERREREKVLPELTATVADHAKRLAVAEKTLGERIAQLEALLESADTRAREAVRRWEQERLQHVTTLGEVEKIQAELATVKVERDNQYEANASLITSIARLEAELAEAQRKHDTYQAEIDLLRKAPAKLQNELQQMSLLNREERIRREVLEEAAKLFCQGCADDDKPTKDSDWGMYWHFRTRCDAERIWRSLEPEAIRASQKEL